MKFITKALITMGATLGAGMIASELTPFHENTNPATVFIGPMVDMYFISGVALATGVTTALILRRF